MAHVVTPLRILVSGSRDWEDWKAIGTAITRWLYQQRPDAPAAQLWQDVTIVHGDARGADRIARDFAIFMGATQEPHRADWDTYGNQAGHIRNQRMVDAGAHVCIAFPLGPSKGTRGCIAAAERAGIPVIVHEGTRP